MRLLNILQNRKRSYRIYRNFSKIENEVYQNFTKTKFFEYQLYNPLFGGNLRSYPNTENSTILVQCSFNRINFRIF
jgi:hypothetical protein